MEDAVFLRHAFGTQGLHVGAHPDCLQVAEIFTRPVMLVTDDRLGGDPARAVVLFGEGGQAVPITDVPRGCLHGGDDFVGDVVVVVDVEDDGAGSAAV